MFRRLPIKVGRFSAAQSAKFGQAVGPVGYLAVGPVAILVSLPARFVRRDPDPSLFDLNKYLRERAEAARQLSED